MMNEERLDRLEWELSRTTSFNRWLLARVGICLGIMVIAWAFGVAATTAQTARTESKIVRAKAFVLEDEKGRTRAGLTVSEDGPILGLHDESEKVRALLCITKVGPALALLDENGKKRIELNVSRTGRG